MIDVNKNGGKIHFIDKTDEPGKMSLPKLKK